MVKSILMLTVIALLLQLPVAAAAASNEPEPGLRLDRLGEQLHLLITSDENKPQLKFEHAQRRLVEAKDLWLADQDEEAKERLAEAWTELNTGLRLTTENIKNSPQFSEATEIFNKLERETRTLIEQPADALETLKESFRNWLDS